MESKSCPQCGAPLSSISSEDFICEFCGKKVKVEKAPSNNNQQPEQSQPVIQKEIVYVRENAPTQEDDYREYDPLGVGMWILCILVPIAGLCSFFYYRSNGYTKKSNQAILAGVIGFVAAWVLFY